MPQRLDVSPNARPEDRFAVVVSKYNADITDRLCESALNTLTQHGVADERILVVPVPGSFEMPLVARQLAASGNYDAVICWGAVIRGATPHFEYVSTEAAKGIAAASQETGVPVLFGVLTTETVEQAIERAGTKAGNKGWDAAMGAIEMANLMGKLDG